MILRNFLSALITLLFVLNPFSSSAKDLNKDINISSEDNKNISYFSTDIPPGKKLPKGIYELGANLSLSMHEQSYISGRTSLEFEVNDNIVNLLNISNGNPFINGQEVSRNSNINLLDFDELWVSYQPKNLDKQCSLMLSLDVQKGKNADRYLLGSNMDAKQHSHQSFISVGGGKILPRDLSYLFNRKLGTEGDNDWRFVEERDEYAYSRSVRINLQNIDNIILDIDASIKLINFRLSRNNSYRPTDVLLWEDIPKQIFTANGKRLISLDFAAAMKKLMPEYIKNGGPINIVELIVFIPKSTSPTLLSSVPIKGLKANYSDSPVVISGEISSLPAHHEISETGTWKWVVNLNSLQKNRINNINFLGGIISETSRNCVGAFKKIELVSRSSQNIPVLFVEAQNSLKNLGVFGLNWAPDSRKIYSPKIISQVMFSELSKSEQKLDEVQLGADGLLSLRKSRIEAEKLSSINFILNDFGLNASGFGNLLISWKKPLRITPELYFSAIPLPFQNFTNGINVTLNFSDGLSVKLPYFLGYALPLGGYAGKSLQSIDLLAHITNGGDSFSLQSINLFSIGEFDFWAILKDAGVKNDIFDAQPIMLDKVEYRAKEPNDIFWHDLADGRGVINFGLVSWGGGDVKLSWISKLLSANIVKNEEWNFSYRGKDDQLQSWILGSSTAPNPNTHLKLTKEWYIIIIILVLLAINRWPYLFKEALLYINLNAVFVADYFSMFLLIFKQTALNIWSLIDKLANVFICLLFFGATLFYFDVFPHDPLWSKLPYVALNISLFVALGFIRRKLIETKAQSDDSALTYLIVNQGSSNAWPPISIWLLSMLMFSWMSLVAYFQFGTVELFLVKSEFIFSWIPWLISIIFGFLPWLLPFISKVLIWFLISSLKLVFFVFGGIKKLIATELRRILIIFFLGIFLYGLILNQLLFSNKNSIILTFGNLIALIMVRIWMNSLKLILHQSWPSLALSVYEDAGSVYLAIALLGLFLAPILMLAGLDFLAIQVMAVVYFGLVIGVVAKIFSMRASKIEGL